MTDVTTTETITVTEPDGTTVEVAGLRGPQGIQGPQGADGDAAAGALLAASNLSDLASASTARTNLGLGTAAVVNTGTGSSNAILGNDSRLTDARTPTAHAASHASAGSDPLTLAQSQVSDLTTDLAAKSAKSANLSDLASASTARTNLGLGNAATKDVGTGSANVSAGDHTHAIDGLLPTQTGNSGKYLTTNGSAASWATVSGGGSSNPEDESTVIASRMFG